LTIVNNMAESSKNERPSSSGTKLRMGKAENDKSAKGSYNSHRESRAGGHQHARDNKKNSVSNTSRRRRDPPSRTTKGPNSNNKSEDPPAKRPRRHADAVAEAKRIWNELRKKSNSPEHNRSLMDRLMPLVAGRAAELALQHDASRVVQAAIQFGTIEERRLILRELCQKQESAAASSSPRAGTASSSSSSTSCLVELCKSQYAHFVALKTIKYSQGDRECAEYIVKALKSHMVKLATHTTASAVVELVFQKLPPKQTSVLKQEFYGPQFALFASDTVREQGDKVPTLKSNILAAPDKKQVTIDHVRRIVNRGLEKQQLLRLGFFHVLLDELLQAIPPEEVRSMVGNTTTASAPLVDSCVHLVSTRAGARAVSTLVAYGTAKDRKRIVKGLKGFVRTGLLHRDAYLPIIRLVQLTDDTVSIQRSIIQEVLAPPPPFTTLSAAGTPEVAARSSEETTTSKSSSSPLLELALSDTASKLFLMLLADKEEIRHKFFDPYEHSVLFPDPCVMENGEVVATSRKDPDVRRRELLQPLRTPLIELCSLHAGELLRSPSGGRIVVQLYSSLMLRRGGDVGALVEALVDACAPSLAKADGEGPNGVPLLEDRCGHLAVKNLILIDASNEGGDECFASKLFDRVTAEGGILAVACSNRGAFVAAALCKVPRVRSAALAQVKANRKRLKDLTEGDGATAGYMALLNECTSQT
jgi:pumilio family protein 6